MTCQSRRLRGFIVRVRPRNAPAFTYNAIAEHSIDVIATALEKHGIDVRLSVRPYAPMKTAGGQA